MSDTKPLAEWQKRAVVRTHKILEDLEKNPEKYGVTREHINKVNKLLKKEDKK